MLKVGLTGGIASGKSTISQLFSDLGIPIIDTDKISHRLMQPGQTGYLQTVEHFGQSILHSDNSINRALLRSIIFNQPEQKLWLENLMHPLIKAETLSQIERSRHLNYVLVVVPLMFETGYNELLDHVIAIDCPTEIQLKRLRQRDHIDDELARKMIASQMENSIRLSLSDSRLPNLNDEDREQDVLELHHLLLALEESRKSKV